MIWVLRLLDENLLACLQCHPHIMVIGRPSVDRDVVQGNLEVVRSIYREIISCQRPPCPANFGPGWNMGSSGSVVAGILYFGLLALRSYEG